MIGVKFTTITISINLLIACFIVISMFGVTSLFEIISSLTYNFLVGITGLYTAGFYFGNRMEIMISKWPNREILIAILSLLIILIIGTFLGSTVGFINEGLNPSYSEYTIADAIFDYYFKPFFWILLFGFIPALITGAFLGRAIRQKIFKQII